MRSASKYHESTVPKNEAQAWVLLVRLLMDVLMVMHQMLRVEERQDLVVRMYGDNIPTSWSFLTGSNDIIIRNATMRSKGLLVMMSSKFPGVTFELGYLPSDKIPADLNSKYHPNPVKTMNSPKWREGPPEYLDNESHNIFCVIKGGVVTSIPEVLSKLQKMQNNKENVVTKNIPQL